MELVKFSTEHILDAAKMMKDVYAQQPWNEEWELDRAQRRISNFVSSDLSVAFKVVKANEVIGYLFGHVDLIAIEDIFFIDEFYLAVAHQRQGNGKIILNLLKEELVQQQVDKIELYTIDEDLDFYRKCGFKESEYIHCEMSL